MAYWPVVPHSLLTDANVSDPTLSHVLRLRGSYLGPRYYRVPLLTFLDGAALLSDFSLAVDLF